MTYSLGNKSCWRQNCFSHLKRSLSRSRRYPCQALGTFSPTLANEQPGSFLGASGGFCVSLPESDILGPEVNLIEPLSKISGTQTKSFINGASYRSNGSEARILWRLNRTLEPPALRRCLRRWKYFSKKRKRAVNQRTLSASYPRLERKKTTSRPIYLLLLVAYSPYQENFESTEISWRFSDSRRSS